MALYAYISIIMACKAYENRFLYRENKKKIEKNTIKSLLSVAIDCLMLVHAKSLF